MILQAVLFALLSTLAVSHPIETEVGQLMMNKSVICKSLGDFSLKFLKALDDQAKDNIIFSPLGLHNLYSMLTHGASGETKKQIIDVLQLSEEDSTKIADEYKKILTYYRSLGKDESKKFMLLTANLLMSNSNFMIKDDFKNKLITSYMTSVSSEDFKKGGEITTKVNSWVKEKTLEMIEHLLDEDISPDALLVLVNAIYFKGEWKEPFVSYYTKRAPFYKDAEQSYDVKMMANPRIEVKYVEDKKAKLKAISIPYHDNVSMYILLPHERTGLQHIKEQITSTKIKDLMSRMTLTNIKLEIPKFQIEKEIDLNSIFSKMGLTLPFGNEANFSEISDTSSKISKSLQKAKIIVDEKGTEAAAASSAISIVRASLGDVHEQFIANHPFLFLIRDDHTHLPLFVGQVTMPKAFSDYPPEPENQ